MQFEYDPNKSETNRLKHGIDFVEAQALWDDNNLLTIRVDRPGEERHVAIGMIGEHHWTAVITYRGENTRIISVRRSRKTETALYAQQQ